MVQAIVHLGARVCLPGIRLDSERSCGRAPPCAHFVEAFQLDERVGRHPTMQLPRREKGQRSQPKEPCDQQRLPPERRRGFQERLEPAAAHRRFTTISVMSSNCGAAPANASMSAMMRSMIAAAGSPRVARILATRRSMPNSFWSRSLASLTPSE